MIEAAVLDTNALIFFAGDESRKLSRAARAFFDRLEDEKAIAYIPAPVVMETDFLLKKGTLKHPLGLRAWWSSLHHSGLIQVDLLTEDIFAAAELNWTHRDPYDRLIVATALRLGLPLVTRDAAITEWGGVPVLW